jgi:hypothetical protein
MRLGAHPLVVAVALGLLGPEVLAGPAAKPARRPVRTESVTSSDDAVVPSGTQGGAVSVSENTENLPAWDALIELADDLRALSAPA